MVGNFMVSQNYLKEMNVAVK